MYNACTLFGLNADSLLNGKVSVGDSRLFKVKVSDQECTVIQFVNELIQIRDAYLALMNVLTMSQCEGKSNFRFLLLIVTAVLCVQILLDGPGNLKFSDFGLSRIEGESIEELFQQFSEAGLQDRHCTVHIEL